MKFDFPHCPTCGEQAVGMQETIPGLALVAFDATGEAQYQGETQIDWDAQRPHRDQEGRVILVCPRGHAWPAHMANSPCDS